MFTVIKYVLVVGVKNIFDILLNNDYFLIFYKIYIFVEHLIKLNKILLKNK